MKKFLVGILVVLFSGCGTLTNFVEPVRIVAEREGYREYAASIPSQDPSFYGFEVEHEIIKKRAGEVEKINLDNTPFNIVDLVIYKDNKMYKDPTPVIGKKLCWGFDGFEEPYKNVRLVNEKLAFTYMPGECNASTTTDVYLDGESVNKKFNVNSSREYFALNGKEIFIAEKDNQDYLFVDGKAVSDGFDTIKTSFCCAMPHFFLEAYSDGKIYFIGVRDEKYYLVEVGVESGAQ